MHQPGRGRRRRCAGPVGVGRRLLHADRVAQIRRRECVALAGGHRDWRAVGARAVAVLPLVAVGGRAARPVAVAFDERLPDARIARNRRPGAGGGSVGGGSGRVTRAGGGAIEVVTVNVDRDPAVGGIDATAVLVQALMIAPVPAGDVGAAGGLLAVPVGKPDVVRLCVAGAVLVDQVADARGGAAVDAGQVSVGVQLRGPGAQERQDRRSGAAARRVGLHVEVERVAGPDPERLGLVDRVARGGACPPRPPGSD